MKSKNVSKMIPQEAMNAAKAIVRVGKESKKADKPTKANPKSGKPVPAPTKVLEKADKPTKTEKLLAMYSDMPTIKKGDSLEKLLGAVTKISTRESSFTSNDGDKGFDSLLNQLAEHVSSGGPTFIMAKNENGSTDMLCAVMDKKQYFISGQKAFKI